MIYSPKHGNYEFPGGGVDIGEIYESALIKEISEQQQEGTKRIAHLAYEFARKNNKSEVLKETILLYAK